MSLLEIDGLTHSFGENVLYKNAGFTLNKGEHIGIVGQNGTGKSTLIKICTEQIIPDSGRIVWQPNTTVGYLDQYAEIDHSLTMKEFLKSAFSKLFDMEAQAMELYEKAADGDTADCRPGQPPAGSQLGVGNKGISGAVAEIDHRPQV